MSQRRRSQAAFARYVRAVFLPGDALISFDDLPNMLGVQRWRVEQLIAEHHVPVVGRMPDLVVHRPYVMLMALDIWSLESIERALGPHASRVLPPLFRLRSVTLRLPYFQIIFLRYLADRRRSSVNAWVADALRALVEKYGDALSADMPELAEALRWPRQSYPHAPRWRKPLPASQLRLAPEKRTS